MANVAKQGAKGVKKRAPKAYKMPDPLPQGEVLEDIFKKKWKLGTSIGKGGFGEIYSAQPYTEKSKAKSGYPYVIKIEPHNNGPLFVEMHFYMRTAKKPDIDEFMSSKKLQSLGMPIYVGSGSHEHKGEKYRFVVMEKYGSDIWKLFLENNRSFPATTVYRIGLQILDVLEYIHSKGYIHGDIKGANILLGLANPNQVYLVDFGLAEHYTTAPKFKPDPKRAHNGTIEYLSRDAHSGVQTRRGDLEILIYNLIQWLGCLLPWESNLKDVVLVQKSKEKYMSDIPEFLKTCFGNRTPPDAIKVFLKELLTIEFNAEPNYEKFRDVLKAGLKSAGGSAKTPLEFKAPKKPSKRPSDSTVSSSPGKKQKLQRKQKANGSNDELAESDHEPDEKKVSKRKVQKNSSKHSKKAQADSEEERDDENDSDFLPQKTAKTRNQLTKNRVKKKIVEDGGDDALKNQKGKRQPLKYTEREGNSSEEDLKPAKQKVNRRAKKYNDKESSNQEDLSDDEKPVQKVKRRAKKYNDKENSDFSDDEKPVKAKRQVKKYNGKEENSDQEDRSDEKPVKLADEKCSDDSDMSTYTAEMRRIKDKMKAVKVAKPRKHRIKKNDAPSASVSSTGNNGNANGDVVSNSEDELPLTVTRRKTARK